MTAVIESKLIDGKPAHRLEGSPPGAWIVAKSNIDAMFDRVQLQLGLNRTAVLEASGINHAQASRCRTGHMPLLERWILRLSDLSGIPVSELRQVACVEPETDAHFRARRAA